MDMRRLMELVEWELTKKTRYEDTAVITQAGNFKKTTGKVTKFEPRRTLTVDGMTMRYNERNSLYIAFVNGKEFTSFGPKPIVDKPKEEQPKGSFIKSLFKK